MYRNRLYLSKGVRPIENHKEPTLTGFSGEIGPAHTAHRFAAIPVVRHVPAPKVQARLEVGAVDDPEELEADRIAEQVMRMPAPDLPQTATTDPLRGVRRKAADDIAPDTDVDAVVRRVVDTGGGQPLDQKTQRFMERRFGHNFSEVRIHQGAVADRSARELQAKAFTHNSHIVFAGGNYAPQTEQGLRLLAHELTHVVQQRAASPLDSKP
jgi:hypothetical protein